MIRAVRDSEPPEGVPPLLEVNGLWLSYGGTVQALRDVCLQVPEGGVVAVLGNNGAGKSTLLRAISGTHRMHGGRIEHGTIALAGRRIDRSDPAMIVRDGVVQVPEGRRIFGELTVDENLRVPARIHRDRCQRGAVRARVFDLFPILAERRSVRAGLLSGGEQQMLAIGRALMLSPRLLLLDEPSLGLSPVLVERMAQVIREIHERGTAVLLIEQNAAMALEVAEYAYVLEVGRVALHGPARGLAATDGVRERYLGVPSANRPVLANLAPSTESTNGDPATRRPRGETYELRMESVSLRFGGVEALSSVNLVVEPGTVHALIGPNGAGKSSCLNVLTGVCRPDAGSVRYGKTELAGMPAHRIANLGISRTFQNIAISRTATVAENLMLGRNRLTRAGYVATALRLPWEARERQAQAMHVAEVADLIGLGHRLNTPAGLLPYGEQKLVELGRALCSDPTLLLLDEPVAGMNMAETHRMAELVAKIQAEFSLSVVIVEHDMSFVMALATRISVLDFGRCIADGSPEQVQRDPEVLRAYLGAAEGPSGSRPSAAAGRRDGTT